MLSEARERGLSGEPETKITWGGAVGHDSSVSTEPWEEVLQYQNSWRQRRDDDGDQDGEAA